MSLFLPKYPCQCDYKDHAAVDVIIANDGFPLEMIEGKPIVNFIRRILHGHHIEGAMCYRERTGIRVRVEEIQKPSLRKFIQKIKKDRKR